MVQIFHTSLILLIIQVDVQSALSSLKARYSKDRIKPIAMDVNCQLRNQYRGR